jgi:uncharacterized protein (DUF362 family)
VDNDVYITETRPEYPRFPYDDRSHPVYCSLLDLFRAWGRNIENPFGDLLEPGDVVVIKPNWVKHYNPRGSLECLITHSSLIKYVIDFAAKALGGRGRIIVGDAPIQGCDFQKLVELSRIQEVLDLARRKYPDIVFELEDWRLTIMHNDVLGSRGQPTQTRRNGYDSLVARDFVLADLGKDSFLEDIADYSENFRVTAYKTSLMLPHHRAGRHEYLVTNRIRQADLMVNLPKMKTHMKAGLTGALKNVIGINGHKEYLPHHIKGAYSACGDGYARRHLLRHMHDELCDYVWERYSEMSVLCRKSLSYLLDALRWGSALCGGESTSVGSWSGNETIWRTTLDLNHILYFSEYSPRRTMTIVDGIVAGEGHGPLKPVARLAGVLIAGENPAYIDAVIARLLGYNISRVPTVHNAIYDRRSKFAGPSLSEFKVTSMLRAHTPEQIGFDRLPNLDFKKPKFWQHAEKKV